VLLSEHNFGGFRALSACIWNLKTANTTLSNSDISESIARKNPGKCTHGKSAQTKRAAAVLRPFERVSLTAT
jgi:hypothetical protein